jgi:hypothetical protein
MGQIIETKINNFSGGMSNDLRVNDASKFSITKHFDSFTYPHKLVPNRSTETDETGAVNVTKFLYARVASGINTYQLYGLGTDGATTKPCLYLYDIDGGFAGGWQGGSYFKSANTDAGATSRILFYYKNYIYVWTTSQLERCDITTATNQFANYQAIDKGFAADPVLHPVDDNAYFFNDNVVYKLANATWTTALTLNADLVITSACAWGNYLAIAAVTRGNSDFKSYVYLWNRDDASWTDIVDFGKGKIVHLANLDNRLVGVMQYTGGNGAGGKNKIIVKQAVGQFGIVVNEITADNTVYLPNVKYIKDNKLYFAAYAILNGDRRDGIWGVDSNGRLSLEYVEENVSNVGKINGISAVGNIWFISHSDDGSINRTNDQDTNSFTSIYESLIFNNGDSSLTKKLLGAEVMFEPLIANDNMKVTLKYRKDADIGCLGLTQAQYDDSWTTIYIYTTTDAISHGAINIETTGVNLPQFKEIQFRIESTSGSTGPVITGLKFKSEIIDKQLF